MCVSERERDLHSHAHINLLSHSLSHTYIHTYIHTYLCVCTSIHPCISTQAHTHAHAHTRTRTHTHTHTHEGVYSARVNAVVAAQSKQGHALSQDKGWVAVSVGVRVKLSECVRACVRAYGLVSE